MYSSLHLEEAKVETDAIASIVSVVVVVLRCLLDVLHRQSEGRKKRQRLVLGLFLLRVRVEKDVRVLMLCLCGIASRYGGSWMLMSVDDPTLVLAGP